MYCHSMTLHDVGGLARVKLRCTLTLTQDASSSLRMLPAIACFKLRSDFCIT
jgi:hypothetical protein